MKGLNGGFNMETRFAFYITGRSGRLMKFLERCGKSQLSMVKLVFSDEEVPEELKNRIESLNIPLIVFPYKNLQGSVQEKRIAFSDRLCKELLYYNVDYCFSFGGHILAGDILSTYKNKIINFHPAILPMYPGCRAIDQAVSHGNTLLVGNTAHFVDAGTDTGPIIMQSVTCLKRFLDTSDYDIVLDLQLDMLYKLIDLFNSGRITVEDNKVLIEGADYNISHCYPLV